jgi:prepilin-type N-terminal cleavage/methylation domain-containing protein
MKTGRQGFTLVELITVIAILAILASIAIPAISNYVQGANANADATTAQNIENALKVSASEIKTGRATPTLKANPTVAYALLNMRLSSSIPTPAQPGYTFCYDKTNQTVRAFQKDAVPTDYKELKATMNLKDDDIKLIS